VTFEGWGKEKVRREYLFGGLGANVLLAENHMGMEQQQHSICSKTTGKMLG
jgi:hypothetical protein